MVLGEIMTTYNYVLLPDIIGSSGNLQSIVPTKTRLLLDLFHGIEVFLELCTWSEYVIQLCNGTDFSKMVTGRAGSLRDAPAQHLTPFECSSTGSPGNRFESSVRLVSSLALLQQCLDEECTVLGLPDSFHTLAGLRGTFRSGYLTCLVIVSGQIFFVSR